MSRVRTEDVITSETQGTAFDDLSISADVKRGLRDSGYMHPTPVQLKSIPIGLLGADMIVKGKAGTGKTLVFAILTLETVDVKSALPQSIIITSTRELALQSADVIRKVGRHREGLSCGAFIGGTSKHEDRRLLRNCQVVVGSAGRLKDLICESGDLYVGSVKLFCLDEVDALLGGKDTHAAINQIFRTLPERKQVCTFSATYIPSLVEILHTYMRTPRFISYEDPKVSLRGVTEYYVEVPAGTDRDVMERKMTELLRIVAGVPFTQCIVFCNDFDAAQDATRRLCGVGIAADCISSRFEQAERSATIKKFADFSLRVLVSSDLTSRGIDMAKVNLVLSLDVPQEAETYMHRIGRTGRYGSLGLAVALFTKHEMQRIAICRRELKADSPFTALPPLATIDVSYMQGVVTSEEDQKKYAAFEKHRLEGKGTTVPRTARRQVKAKKAGEKRRRDEQRSPSRSASPTPAPQGNPPAKRAKAADATPAVRARDTTASVASSHVVHTPVSTANAAPAPAAAATSRPPTFIGAPSPAPLIPVPTFPSPPPLAAHTVLAAPVASYHTGAPVYPVQPVSAPFAPHQGAALPQQTWVQETHQRLCAHYDSYYRAYYHAAAECIVKACAGVPVTIPQPPAPPAGAL